MTKFDLDFASDVIVFLYNVPSRFYHNFDHITFCLNELENVTEFLDRPEDVRIALLFHDIVHDTHLSNNEELSAELATLFLQSWNIPDYGIKNVTKLILATKHDKILTDNDSQYVADIDLASLGLPWKQFDKNSKSIRKEYSWVSEDEYCSSRAAIFQGLLSRKLLNTNQGIYYTDYFREKYGKQAIDNVCRHITELST